MGSLAIYMPRRDAEEWMREAVLLAFDATSLHHLTPAMRALAFQRTCVTVELLHRDGAPLDMVGPEGNRDFLLWPSGSITDPEPGDPTYRERIAAAFRTAFQDPDITGPPWQVGTADSSRLPYDEWCAQSEE
jgi:hypothetical protein